MPDLSDAYEIFLSYARADNEREGDDSQERGWVDYFQARLLKQLRRRGRDDVGFWRDIAAIAKADQFDPALMTALAESHFFLPIVSPNYLKRPWCQKEVDEFARREAREPGINQRIVPVYKLPPDSAQLPPLIQGRSGFHFYEQDPVSQKMREFYRRGRVRDEYENDYADLLDEIADYICTHLPEHAPHAKVDNPPLSAAVFTVFVAPVADDMFPAYERIVTELKSQGVRVVIDPEQELPRDAGAAIVAVDEALEQAQLVVHLLGEDAGPRMSGGPRLVDSLLDQTLASATPRVVWAPATLFKDPTSADSSVREHGRNPLQVLNMFGAFRDGDSVTDAPFEAFLQDLVRRCHTLRSPLQSQAQGAAAMGADAPSVYVVGKEEDASLVQQVTSTLIENHRLKAYPCGFQGAPDEIRNLHEQEMRDSDAVLYCWGEAPDTWLRAYTREARSPEKLGRQQPFRATAVVLGPPFNEYKQNFRSADVGLHLCQTGEITPEAFIPLVEALQATPSAALR